MLNSAVIVVIITYFDVSFYYMSLLEIKHSLEIYKVCSSKYHKLFRTEIPITCIPVLLTPISYYILQFIENF